MFCGLSKHEVTWYVDELDIVLAKALGINIHTATMTGEVEDHIEINNNHKEISKMNFKLEVDSTQVDNDLDKIATKIENIHDSFIGLKQLVGCGEE